MSHSEIVLHVWPAKWSLPSIDPACLSAVLYLQLAIPGRFSISECTNPDLSPSGQLPFLTHEHHVVSPLLPITKYVAALKRVPLSGESAEEERGVEGHHHHHHHHHRLHPNLDQKLSATQLSQRAAWMAYIEAHLGDLVACSFYSLDSNWWDLTRPTLAQMLPVPQRYYVPDRLRLTYKPRLEATGFWSHSADAKDTEGEETDLERERRRRWEREQGRGQLKKAEDAKSKEAFRRAFGREKLAENATVVFGILERVLRGEEEGSEFFFASSRPTSLDVSLAAHILLLITAPLPSNPLSSLLAETHPSLIEHAKRVLALALPADSTTSLIVHPAPTLRSVLSSLLPFPPAFRQSVFGALSGRRPGLVSKMPKQTRSKSRGAAEEDENEDAERAKEEEAAAATARFNSVSWRILGAVALGTAAFWYAYGPRVVLSFEGDDDEEQVIDVEEEESEGEGEDEDKEEELMDPLTEAAVDEIEVTI